MTKTNYRIKTEHILGTIESCLQFQAKDGSWRYVLGDGCLIEFADKYQRNSDISEDNFPVDSGVSYYAISHWGHALMRTSPGNEGSLERWAKKFQPIQKYFDELTKKRRAYLARQKANEEKVGTRNL